MNPPYWLRFWQMCPSSSPYLTVLTKRVLSSQTSWWAFPGPLSSQLIVTECLFKKTPYQTLQAVRCPLNNYGYERWRIASLHTLCCINLGFGGMGLGLDFLLAYLKHQRLRQATGHHSMRNLFAEMWRWSSHLIDRLALPYVACPLSLRREELCSPSEKENRESWQELEEDGLNCVFPWIFKNCVCMYKYFYVSF